MKMQSQNNRLLHDIAEEKAKRSSIEVSGNRNSEPNLKSISDALDSYYFINKLSVYCAYLSFKNIVHPDKIKYSKKDIYLIEEIIKHIECNNYSNPEIKILIQIKNLFKTIDKNSVQQDLSLKRTLQLINENENLYSTEESLELYSLLNNYCIRKINHGRTDYKSLFLQTNIHMINVRYKNIPQKKIIMETGLFKNIVAVALTSEDSSFSLGLNTHGLVSDNPDDTFENKYDWVEKFIGFYGQKLGESSQAKFYYQYCRAFLEFSRKKFARAYKIFNNQMRIQGTFLNLDMKILHLKILYEVHIRKARILAYDKIEIKRVLDSYRKLINYEISQTQDLSYQIPFYANFEKKYKQLYNLYNRYDGKIDNQKNDLFLKKKKELRDSINENSFTYNKWLQEKLSEIK